MIVRNEEKIIQRCLESVKPHISHWIICDTGSTDRTRELIRATLDGIPGQLFDDEWVDFSHNRNLGLERADKCADYLLLLDADMVLHAGEDFRSRLEGDCYFIPFTGDIDYAVVRLISTRHRWSYRGAVHEVIESSASAKPARLPGVSITHLEDGKNREDKIAREIRMLESDLEKGPDNSRTIFYLAQCHRDAGNFEKASNLYQKRVGMSGWIEETWYALYQLGRMQEIINGDIRVAFFTYLQAYNFRPTRLEPIYPIARFYREHQQWALGYHFARLVLEAGYPDDILFVERNVYKHLLAEEYAICCRQTGRAEEADRIEAVLSASRETLNAAG